MMTEHSLKDVDKKNPIYTCFKAWGLSLLLYIAPSPYDVIGAIPDIYDFWIPKFEELSTGHSNIKEIVCETSTIQEAFEKSLTIFNRQQHKSITGGKTLKALPASKEDPNTNTDNKSTP
ncbi:hypothetical protein B7486_39220 [cyanobacterium TDX16]|nr:hypothetical protein B7486_39220 [cyanobacterium TDX16]